MKSKYYSTIVILRKMALMQRRLVLPFKLIRSGFFKQPSYYPEMNRKSKIRIFIELLFHIFRYGAIEWHYFSYGFDIKGYRKQNEYMDDAEFMWQNNMLNMIQSNWDYTCLLRDKNLFAELLTMWGYQTPRVLVQISGEEETCAFLGSLRRGGYFCKILNGECGKGTFKIICETERWSIDGKEYSVSDAKEIIKKRLLENTYIVQNIVEQLPEINAIYPNALNTLRITTYYDKKKQCAVPFAGFYRVGANQGIADNWAAGGILVGMDIRTGKLKKYGYFKHGYGTKVTAHPDSGFVFENYQLPFYEQAMKQALELHEKLKGIPVIGWDIALTSNGPMFIEGNDNVEMGPLQLSEDRGLKKEYLEIKQKCLG